MPQYVRRLQEHGLEDCCQSGTIDQFAGVDTEHRKFGDLVAGARNLPQSAGSNLLRLLLALRGEERFDLS